MLWILIAGVLAALVYYYVIQPHSYWKRRGVHQNKPFFLLGDKWKFLLKLEPQFHNVQNLYRAGDGHRYLGIYQTLTPTLMIRDPELLKQITVKDFDHFQDHRSFIPDGADPLWSQNLLQLKGETWREIRATLSPSFTSSKMRLMFVFMAECADRVMKHFADMGKDTISIDLRDVFTRYTTDVIGSTSFGVHSDSLKDRDNEFYLKGNKLSNFGFWGMMKFFLFMLIPSTLKFLGVRFFPEDVRLFFRNLIKETIEYREKENVKRQDMLDLLLKARKNELKYDEEKTSVDASFAAVEESEIGRTKTGKQIDLSDDDITAHAMIFFFAGNESTSTLMCFMAYELCIDPDIQNKLYEEVLEIMESCNEKLTYEDVIKMKYLDMVISETLRKWPSFSDTDRIVTKPYTIKPTNQDEKPVYLEKDVLIEIPIVGLHYDEKYFPNPKKFDPERFSEENKKDIHPYTYLPFGIGPRNCIGSRFALLETKVIMCYLLAKFEIVPNKKMKMPIKITKTGINMSAEGGFWFGLKRRK